MGTPKHAGPLNRPCATWSTTYAVSLAMKLVLQIAAGVILAATIIWLAKVALGISVLASLASYLEGRSTVTGPINKPALSTPPGSGWVDKPFLPNGTTPALPFSNPPKPAWPAVPLTDPLATKPMTRPIRQHRKVWVPGRPLEECMGASKELNPEVLRCHEGYYRQE